METETAPTAADYRAAAEAVVERYQADPGFIIPMMQDLQAQFEHVPRDGLLRMSELLKVPLSQLYSVATFYSSFSLTPRGKHLITLCMGTVCYLKGAREIAEALQEQLGVEAGGTTDDRLFTYQPVNCLGACALAPLVVMDGKNHAKATTTAITKVIDDSEDSDSDEKEAS